MNKLHKSELEASFRKPIQNVSFKELLNSSFSFFEEVGTPCSLALWLMLDNEEYEQYLSYNIDPLSYTDHVIFKRDYQCTKLFSKLECFPKVLNTKKEAEKKFIECELSCKQINDTIIKHGFSHLFKGENDLSEVISLTIRKISSVLGVVPSMSTFQFKFGPGLNVGLSNNKTSVYDKLSIKPSITNGLLAFLKDNPIEHPAWENINASLREYPSVQFTPINRWQIVPGSRLTFVPKNAKTDRPICIEPLMNSYVQSGIGGCIRRRLKKCHVDLKDQTINQEFARESSLTNHLATVDLSSASDTISYMVVLNLLPLDWFELLDVTRCSTFDYESKTYPLEKISSMGNGFTFELESLIFYSLAHSVCRYLKLPTNEVNSYGDDIIIPVEGYDLLSRALSCLGFKVNLEKSFLDGPFRESCGKDYFLGYQVRPLFLKRSPSASSLMYWCNHIRRMQGPFSDPAYHKLWLGLRKLVPEPFKKLQGPDGAGDGHFIVPFDEYTGNRVHSKTKRGWEGYGFYTILAQPIAFRTNGLANYAEALYNAQHCNLPPSMNRLKSVCKSGRNVAYKNASKWDAMFGLNTTGRPIPESWDGFTGQRDRVRNVLTKSFAVWKDINSW